MTTIYCPWCGDLIDEAAMEDLSAELTENERRKVRVECDEETCRRTSVVIDSTEVDEEEEDDEEME